jgi:hypothetical protein
MQLDFDELRDSHPIESLYMLCDSAGVDVAYASARFLTQMKRAYEGKGIIKYETQLNEPAGFLAGVRQGLFDRQSSMSDSTELYRELFAFLIPSGPTKNISSELKCIEDYKIGYVFGWTGFPVEAYRALRNRAYRFTRSDASSFAIAEFVMS